MSQMNGIGPIVDLGEIQRRQQEKAKVPSYSVGTPEFALQVGVPAVEDHINFRDAIDRVATLLDADGFTIEEVKQCIYAGVTPDGVTLFNVAVRVSDTEVAF
jgi:hypothetical protein